MKPTTLRLTLGALAALMAGGATSAFAADPAPKQPAAAVVQGGPPPGFAPHGGLQGGPDAMGRKGPPPQAITRDQALKRAGDQFDRMDTNKDGTLTPDEMRTFREARLKEMQSRMAEAKAQGHQPTVQVKPQPAPTR